MEKIFFLLLLILLEGRTIQSSDLDLNQRVSSSSTSSSSNYSAIEVSDDSQGNLSSNSKYSATKVMNDHKPDFWFEMKMESNDNRTESLISDNETKSTLRREHSLRKRQATVGIDCPFECNPVYSNETCISSPGLAYTFVCDWNTWRLLFVLSPNSPRFAMYLQFIYEHVNGSEFAHLVVIDFSKLELTFGFNNWYSFQLIIAANSNDNVDISIMNAHIFLSKLVYEEAIPVLLKSLVRINITVMGQADWSFCKDTRRCSVTEEYQPLGTY